MRDDEPTAGEGATPPLARLRAAAAAGLQLLLSPAAIAAVLLVAGLLMLLAGAFLLWGLGVALMVGSVPALLGGMVLARGVMHDEEA